MKRKISLNAVLFIFLAVLAQAQDYAPPPAPNGQIMSGQQLDQLLGPIALYPDPLIAQILPASTQPSQIAVAYNFVASGGDPNAIDQQAWDSSVKAVAHYPDVLRMLDSSLPWTTQLGQAFLNQAPDVMSSIQRLRAQAQQLGNLASSPQLNVVADSGDIEILPADPDMIYVPTYDPSLVFYQPPYGRNFLSFGVGFRIGGWLDHDFDWHGRHLITWGRDHPRPGDWWRERPADRRAVIGRAPVFRPEARPVGRPVVAERGDRGFVNRDIHVAAPREVRPASRPVEVHTIPARPAPRPAVSAFVGSRSAPETRAASVRGAASRAPAAGGGGGGRKR